MSTPENAWEKLLECRRYESARKQLYTINVTELPWALAECQSHKTLVHSYRVSTSKKTESVAPQKTEGRCGVSTKKKRAAARVSTPQSNRKHLPSVKATKRPKTFAKCEHHPAIATVVPTIRHQPFSLYKHWRLARSTYTRYSISVAPGLSRPIL
jgi:hypothetical protein